ncbi:MAG: phosphatidylserine decarboxylase family protein [Muribaculaceae bacterium]|nr:phosphatidylserine decarboxylase family protein [Muribaculaceae bacterium]
MRVKVHHEGINILIVTLIALLAINLPLWLWGKHPVVATVCTVVSAVLYLSVVNFFRSPRRAFKGDPENAVVSSADGKVVALEETYEGEYLHGKAVQISVFMTVFNVHANWFPVDGEVIYTKHHSGRFQAAWLPKSSTDNERSTVVIRTPEGQLVVVRQIAGAIARRIVTYAHPGIEASIEDHMGFIKFGSRVDIFVPVGSEILVKLGDHTTGGVTQVAKLKPTEK